MDRACFGGLAPRQLEMAGRLAHRLRSRLGALARPLGEPPRHPGQRPGGPTGQGETVPEPAGEDDVSGGALAGPVAALAFLYVAGASLVAVALLLPFWPEANLGALWALVGLAFLVGLGLFEVRRRGVEPSLEVLAALVAAGTTIVAAAAALAAGPRAVLAVGVFYAFPAGSALYAFPPIWAVAEIAYGAATLAGVLWLLDPPAAAAQWVLVTGAAVVAGAVIGGLGQQARRSYEAGRRIAEALRDVDTLETGLLRAARHDLGTPLTAVTGLLQTIRGRRDQLPAETRDQLLDRAVANARRLEPSRTWRTLPVQGRPGAGQPRRRARAAARRSAPSRACSRAPATASSQTGRARWRPASPPTAHRSRPISPS